MPHLSIIYIYFETIQWIKAEMVVETCWSLGNTSWQIKASPPRGFLSSGRAMLIIHLFKRTLECTGNS